MCQTVSRNVAQLVAYLRRNIGGAYHGLSRTGSGTNGATSWAWLEHGLVGQEEAGAGANGNVPNVLGNAPPKPRPGPDSNRKL